MCHPWCRTRIHLHPLACTWSFHLRLSLPCPRHQPPRSRCRSTNTALIHKMRSVALRPKQPPLQVMSPTRSTTSTTQRLFQRPSRMNPSTKTRNRRTRSMRNSTMSLLESVIFTTVHSGARRFSEPETNLSLSWRKFVTSSVLFHTNKYGWNSCTNQVQSCLKNGNQVATWKTSKPGFSLKDKKSKFLLKSDLRSRSTNSNPSQTEEVSRN